MEKLIRILQTKIDDNQPIDAKYIAEKYNFEEQDVIDLYFDLRAGQTAYGEYGYDLDVYE